MAIRKIVKYPDPFLRKPTNPINEFAELRNSWGDNPLHQDIDGAIFTLISVDHGAALSANQIGIDKSFFVVHPKRPTDLLSRVIFNPRVASMSSETSTEKEGCLSFPGVSVAVRRPVGVSVVYYDFSGVEYKQDLVGWWSRVFQHETDHLNGKLFVDELSAKKRVEIAKSVMRTK